MTMTGFGVLKRVNLARFEKSVIITTPEAEKVALWLVLTLTSNLPAARPLS